ncbi:hypothetical protein [Streptomyces thermolilacinus]|uniref:hypothetical protein n=1 Tax=Streptomyces thermolilacinus TaxID=285540 RepID=UPI0033F5A758
MSSAVLVAAIGLGALAGCTVPSAGRAGVAMSQTGRPLGVVVMCQDHIDGTTLYLGDDDASVSARHVARWEAEGPVTGFATWPLDAPPEESSPFKAPPSQPPRLENGVRYVPHGWTTDNSSAAAHVEFTLADLAVLKPGQVRYWVADTEGSGPDGYKAGTVAEIRTDVCGGT